MINCYIRKQAELRPKAVAIFTKDGPINYATLDKLVDQTLPRTNIFYTPTSLESILKIFSCLRKKICFAPISVREPLLPKDRLPDNAALVLFTSGSTGTPKGVVHTLESAYAGAEGLSHSCQFAHTDQFLLSLPINRIGGLLVCFRAFATGGTLVLPDANSQDISILTVVPTQLKQHLEEKLTYKNLRKVLVGGAPLPHAVAKEAIEKGIDLVPLYGTTETSSIFAGKWSADEGVVYDKLAGNIEYKLADDGEVLVRGKAVFQRYLNAPKPFVKGWYSTGDIAKATEDGIKLVGRKRRLIISGGENIQLEEIEVALMSIPEVTKVVAGVRPDVKWGERPTAYICLKSAIPVETLRSKLGEKLAMYKIPDEEDWTITRDPNEFIDKSR